MKRSLFAILVLFVLAGCKENAEKDKNPAAEVHATDEHGTEDKTETIALNNGSKWKADSSTNANVRNLQLVVDKFDASAGKSLADFTVTAADLQSGLDKLVGECRMKGPDHDALHKWLEPLIGQVKKLKETGNEQEAAQQVKAIHEQLKLYPQYFE